MLKPILDDWIKVGTMQIVSRYLSGGSFNDSQWQQSSVATLLGFTAYHLLVKDNVDTSRAGQYKAVADDWLKVGTMLIVSRLLTGGSLDDPQWVMTSLYTLIGFTVYNLLTKQLYDTGNLDPETKQIADDFLKVGTMLTTSHLLSGGTINKGFARSTANTLTGFAAGELIDLS
ncbi:MAG: hypothetical protein CMF62_03520 [Magnetococcales bacterium]|nr:hypothetical protein [Magnetococcales bacterium]|tara:strand:- start:49334 stop:49852 length:519 start_codon:yes stop_codon:yes gene_type:complete